MKNCIGFIGSNGLGKSTILKILSGEIKLNMKDVYLKKMLSGNEIFKYLSNIDKKKIAYKPQDVMKMQNQQRTD